MGRVDMVETDYAQSQLDLSEHPFFDLVRSIDLQDCMRGSRSC